MKTSREKRPQLVLAAAARADRHVVGAGVVHHRRQGGLHVLGDELGSAHPAGANFLFADGSVRTIR
jgi:prepilin-type processing-associated H-X9-DG protein